MYVAGCVFGKDKHSNGQWHERHVQTRYENKLLKSFIVYLSLQVGIYKLQDGTRSACETAENNLDIYVHCSCSSPYLKLIPSNLQPRIWICFCVLCFGVRTIADNMQNCLMICDSMCVNTDAVKYKQKELKTIYLWYQNETKWKHTHLHIIFLLFPLFVQRARKVFNLDWNFPIFTHHMHLFHLFNV